MQIPEINTIAELDALTVAAFQRAGVLIVRNVIPQATVEAVRERFAPLFQGDFDTGVYPDEWYWREGLSLPEATRHMSNAWKADSRIAAFVRDPVLAAATARLMGWPGVRLGQDTLWWKVPGSAEAAFHQDASFVDFLFPPIMATCWIALDDTQSGCGTLEYVAGSHDWLRSRRPLDFHHPKGGYRARMMAAAAAAGFAEPEVCPVEVTAGSVVFHHGLTWHGSQPNPSAARSRRSIGIHYLPIDARFAGERGGYIYGRYKRPDSDRLDDCFFPPLAGASAGR